jgi:hypothetical protein
MKRTVITEYKSEKYGIFSIEETGSKCVIWWDFYDENDGDQLSPDMDVWMVDECDITDFSDMPKHGEFKSHDEAYEYIVRKFGKIE